MTTLAELVTTPPQGGHGYRIAHSLPWAEQTEWRLAVEIAIPAAENPGIWDVGRWDQALWSVPEWKDITEWVRGIDIQRGSDATQRPQVGVATVELDNTDNLFARWSSNTPFVPAYYEPGTLFRVVIHEPCACLWYPLFTGIVESWQESYEDSASQVSTVTVTAIETLTLLARINDFAGTAVGEGDTPTQRLQRLLDASSWPFGFLSETSRTTPLSATEMSENRIAECYSVVDSIDAVFRTARDGRAYCYDRDSNPASFPYTDETFVLSHRHTHDAGHACVPYVDGSLRTSNDDDRILNYIALSARGGTQNLYQNTTSINRYGKRTYTRSELWYQNAQRAAASQHIADRMLARSVIYRPEGVSLDASISSCVLAFMVGIDVGDVVDVEALEVTFNNVAVCQIHHRITPIPDGAVWTTDLLFSTTHQYSWETRGEDHRRTEDERLRTLSNDDFRFIEA